MIVRLTMIAALSAATALLMPGCSVVRDQESVGNYIDDTALTTRVKARFAEEMKVSAFAIRVESLKSVVQLSGFARSDEERMTAERLARDTSGVVGVRNDIIVRPG